MGHSLDLLPYVTRFCMSNQKKFGYWKLSIFEIGRLSAIRFKSAISTQLFHHLQDQFNPIHRKNPISVIPKLKIGIDWESQKVRSPILKISCLVDRSQKLSCLVLFCFPRYGYLISRSSPRGTPDFLNRSSDEISITPRRTRRDSSSRNTDISADNPWTSFPRQNSSPDIPSEMNSSSISNGFARGARCPKFVSTNLLPQVIQQNELPMTKENPWKNPVSDHRKSLAIFF